MVSFNAWHPTVTSAPGPAVSWRMAADPFDRLFQREYAKVVAIAYRVLADQPAAEDVAQEVFLKFHRSLSPDSERASGWLHSAAVHTALNVLRGNRRRLQRETVHARQEGQSGIDNPEQLVELAERRRVVREAMRRLPHRSAAILALRYSGLSYAEIAAAIGTRVSHVGTMLRRAEQALRREVTDAAPE